MYPLVLIFSHSSEISSSYETSDLSLELVHVARKGNFILVYNSSRVVSHWLAPLLHGAPAVKGGVLRPPFYGGLSFFLASVILARVVIYFQRVKILINPRMRNRRFAGKENASLKIRGSDPFNNLVWK